MAPRPREGELAAYLDDLARWALAAVRVMWATVDPDDIRPTWAGIAGPLTAIHERLTVAALDATDAYMLLTAADSEMAYLRTWDQDFATRAGLTPWGADAAAWIGATPALVLWRIKGGATADDALTFGLNRLARPYGTTAHHIAREVTRARVVEDLAAPPATRTWSRWRRKTSAGACAWCLMLATRGAVYRSEQSTVVGSRTHHYCRCTALLETDRRARDAVAIHPADANRTIAVRPKQGHGRTYTYDLREYTRYDDTIPTPRFRPTTGMTRAR